MTSKLRLLALFTLLLPGLLMAQFQDYYDHSAWQVDAGAITGSEDFESFTSDTCFGDSLALNDGISIGPGCTEDNSFGKVDVSPFEFAQTDLNGNASASVNNFQGTCLEFETPISAFGALFGQINDTQLRTEIELSLSLGDVVQGTVVPTVDGGTNRFYGFIGPEFDTLCFNRITSDGFGIDDIEIVGGPGVDPVDDTLPVPTLNQWGLILLSLMILLTAVLGKKRHLY